MKQVKNNVYWVGKIDWEMTKFHGSDFSIDSGSSQNAYLIKEEKTVLVDTVWIPHAKEFVENLEKEIDLDSIDYIVVNHGECDHSGALPYLMSRIPDKPIYCTAQAVQSLTGQYHHPEWDFHVVKTGDTLDIGNGKKLTFIQMTMLHWPDSMATYISGDNILFSMDAFGQHYAVEEMFADKADQEKLWREAVKYYVNILMPFSSFVAKKIPELKGLNLPIDMIAPSHGAIWRDNPMQIVDKYAEWSNDYKENQITVIYDSMWNGTATLAHRIADEIHAQDPETTVKVMSAASADKNDIMVEVFRSKAVAVGSPTIVRDIMSSMTGLLAFMKELHFTGKKAAVFGCYGWSGESTKILREKMTECGFEVAEPEIKSQWNPDEKVLAQAEGIAKVLLEA